MTGQSNWVVTLVVLFKGEIGWELSMIPNPDQSFKQILKGARSCVYTVNCVMFLCEWLSTLQWSDDGDGG